MARGSWVEEVLGAIGLEVAHRARDRVWCLCPGHQRSSDPKSWATTFFVRTIGKRRDSEGRLYEAAGQHFCFACGIGGSIVDLVVRVRGCDEEAARRIVKDRGGPRGVKVEEVTKRVVVARVQRPILTRFRMPRGVIFEPLERWVTPAREYVEGRGITAEEVEEFGIGYAVGGGKLGGRIVFPLLGRGRVVGSYSARTFVGAEPPYTTPGPDEGADRSVLFGEHLWPDARSQRDLVAVFEGAINGLVIRRAVPGICLAGIGGAANFDAEQAKKLATFRRALVLTDPDEAGDKAAHVIEGMIGRYAETRRVRFPRGKDAADVGVDGTRRIIERALSEWNGRDNRAIMR